MIGKSLILIVIFSIFLVAEDFAQDSLTIITDLSTLKTKPSRLEAKNYLGIDWRLGNVYLFNQNALLNQQIRYDLDNKLIEIRDQNAIRILESFRVRRFEWTDDGERYLYTNCASFQYTEWVEGFYRVLAQGEITLLERTEIKVEQDRTTGSIDTQRFVPDEEPDELETSLYMARGSSVVDLGRKKEVLSYFGEKATLVETYSKENRLNFRNKKHLIRIVEYYNGIP